MSDPRVVSEHQIVAEWSEARQLLNDNRLSDYSLPEAITVLLGYRDNVLADRPQGVIDLAEVRKSKHRHPSSRRRADLAVPPEVTP